MKKFHSDKKKRGIGPSPLPTDVAMYGSNI